MINTLLTGWNFMRWLRLGLGILVGIQSVQAHDAFSGIISAFLLFQAVTNTGCCGAGACAVPQAKNQQDGPEEAVFEEVRSKQDPT